MRRADQCASVLWRDWILRAMVAWALLAVVLWVGFDGHADWQARIFWTFQPPLDAALAFCSWRVSRLAAGAVRRFWRAMAFAGMLFTAGDASEVLLSWSTAGQISYTGGPVQTTAMGAGLAVSVMAMLVHPLPNRSGRERVAFWLDATTVLVGGMTVAWCFGDLPDDTGFFGSLLAPGLFMCASFAVVKVVLSGSAPMNRVTAAVMFTAGGLSVAGILLEPLESTVLMPLVQFTRFVPALLIAGAARIQQIVAQLSATPFGERRKHYSLLPYVSMSVAFGALVLVLPHGITARVWGVLTGLGVICALVAGRQLVAFHDNTALIRRLREQESHLRRQALSDGLTGLANRRCLTQRITAALHETMPLALLLIDLDGFKQVNDTMGHAAGDALLVEVAAQLRATAGEQDLPARLGGDEFAVLLPDTSLAGAERTADRLLVAFRTGVRIDGTQMPVNASIGVAAAGPDATVETLLHDADLAMYMAKSEGKGTQVTFTPKTGAFHVA